MLSVYNKISDCIEGETKIKSKKEIYLPSPCLDAKSIKKRNGFENLESQNYYVSQWLAYLDEIKLEEFEDYNKTVTVSKSTHTNFFPVPPQPHQLQRW